MAGDGLAVFLDFDFLSTLGALTEPYFMNGFFVSYFLSSLASFFSAARSSLKSCAASRACETTCVVVLNLTDSCILNDLVRSRLPLDDPRPDFISFKKSISVGSTYKLSIVVFSFGFSVNEALRFSFESFVIVRFFNGSRILLILRRLDFEGLAAD